MAKRAMPLGLYRRFRQARLTTEHEGATVKIDDDTVGVCDLGRSRYKHWLQCPMVEESYDRRWSVFLLNRLGFFGLAGMIVMYPIAPELPFVGPFMKQPANRNFRRDQVTDMNKSIAKNATRQLYARVPLNSRSGFLLLERELRPRRRAPRSAGCTTGCWVNDGDLWQILASSQAQ
ncbi:MAG TPA: hypothetical protein VGC14_00205 [Rhizobium sp.]